MATPLLPGDPQQLGAFYLDGRLGAGGQGVVYEGYGPDGERVAVKALHGVGDTEREMLRKEVRAWRKVAPFCTAKVLYEDLDGPIPFIASEYVAGPNLRQAVEQGGPFGAEELRRLAIGVAAALVAVHRAGVVHRDLKPENILLGPDGARLIDFGIARIGPQSTTSGLVKGTLRYMPPERYRGERGDAAVDVWGWGAVVLFAATGRHAFDGATVPLIQRQVAEHEPDVSMLDEPLRSLVRGALAKRAADRPGSEELLLGLAGGVDVAEAVKGLIPRDPFGPVGPSRAEVAESVYAGLGGAAQEAAPQVFLRLVAPGERAEDTVRTARRDEFPDVPGMEEALGSFTEAGILVWEDGRVALSSAALIRSWPRLRHWVEEERAGLSVHVRLGEAARLWDDHGRKNTDLYQGTALERAMSWAATGRRRLTLNAAERAFLDAGSALQRRRGRTRTLVSAVLAVLMVMSVGAAAVAIDQWRTVSGQRDRATAVQVAGLAQSLRRTRPELARRLAVAAARLGPGSESWSALLSVRHQWEDDARRLPGIQVALADLDGAGRVLAVAGGRDGAQVEFWNVETRRRTGSFTAPAKVKWLSLAADGRTAAVAAEDGSTYLVDTATGRRRGRYPSAVRANRPWVALSRSGTFLAVEELEDKDRARLTVWDTRSGRALLELTGSVSDFLLNATSFSPDEKVLSVPAKDSEEPFTWYDTATMKKIPAPGLGPEAAETTGPATFSPDGRRAAVRLKDGRIRVLDRAAGYGTDLSGGEKISAYPLRFSPDGRFLAQGAVVWDTGRFETAPVMRYSLSYSECLADTGLPFTADGSRLRCVGNDGTVRSFDIGVYTKTPAPTGTALYHDSAVSGDRSTLALAQTRTVHIWSVPGRTLRAAIPVSAFGDDAPSVDGMELSRTGRLLAVGLGGNRIGIWDVNRGAKVAVVTGPLDPAQVSGGVQVFAFSPDERSLAVEAVMPNGDNALAFWDLTGPRRTFQTRARLGNDGGGANILFAPDGKSLVAAPYFGRVAFPSGRVLTRGSAALQADAQTDDGTTLISQPSLYQPYIRRWDARTLQQSGDDLRIGKVIPYDETASVSPDGRLFATAHEASPNYQIKLWDGRARAQLGVPLTGPVDVIVTTTFTPDGSALLSVDKRGRFHTYAVAPARLISELCSRSGQLTRDEWKRHIPNVPYRETC